MARQLQIGIIGDYDAEALTHRVTHEAIDHAAAALAVHARVSWVATADLATADLATADLATADLATADLANGVGDLLGGFDALWCAPGSPYRSLEGALAGIRYARESRLPFLGTCAGFQHVVLEYARNVIGFVDAQHAEYDPAASHLFINQLACSLVGKKMTIVLKPSSRAYGYYGRSEVMEQYYCRFGLNPTYQPLIEAAGLHIAGYDTDGEARIVELPDHPFYLATLFLPQLDSTAAQPHPLISAYLSSALTWQGAQAMADGIFG